MIIILKKLEFYILQVINNHHLLKLIKLVLKIFILGHIIACSWYLLSRFEREILNSDHSWIDQSVYLNHDSFWRTKYMFAIYWAFNTMMNVSSDFSLKSELELGFTSICMLFSCFMFGYMMKTIGYIIKDINRQEELYQRDVSILNKYMKRKHIDT